MQSPNVKGYKRAPIVHVEIDEAVGKVIDAKLKRSSGSGPVDDLAVDEVSHWKFWPKRGCGIVESDMVVLIHWGSP